MEVSAASVGLDGVLEAFQSGQLSTLTMREFAATNSMVGGPGIVRCGCRMGDCSDCKLLRPRYILDPVKYE